MFVLDENSGTVKSHFTWELSFVRSYNKTNNYKKKKVILVKKNGRRQELDYL
jgi:hypothetical protein